MANQEALEEYSSSIKRLKRQCTEAGMSEEEFRKMYFETLSTVETSRNPRRFNYKTLFYLVLALVLCGTIVNYRFMYIYISSNMQEYIYPGLRILRKLSIPFISLFPSLTEFYHETCLVQNPFFSVVDMDCWPCSSVNNVRHMYDPEPVGEHHSAPFIYETNQAAVNLRSLYEFYNNNKQVFDREISKVIVDNKLQVNPDEMFLQIQGEHTFIWRFNNMNLAKTIRQLIPRPKIVPKFGQSTERYIVIDSSQNRFKVPDTECSFSFIMSLSSSRVVTLTPAEECKHQCKSLKVELKESFLLWYNWWYWRPVVEPSNDNSTFIGHIGSYC